MKLSRLFCLIALSMLPALSIASNKQCPTQSQLEKMAEPPFYFLDFDEHKNISLKQKNLLKVEIEKIENSSKALHFLKSNELKNLANEECQWEARRWQIWNSCQEKSQEKLCKHLIEIRIKVLESGTNRR